MKPLDEIVAIGLAASNGIIDLCDAIVDLHDELSAMSNRLSAAELERDRLGAELEMLRRSRDEHRGIEEL